ncbi:MAG: SUMF1/EgtB/PvdO family nonheme iron enzyme, partial [Planctomycetes bacterium]|nr:SUMF1/EgtB/PvdO family nonheme iron enzyme [Planctomycetota bacterium]
CQDWYGDYPTSPVTGPAGSSSGSARVIRGGSWFITAEYCVASFRYRYRPGYRRGNVGFRLLRSL